jgi:hypothetical protein
LCDLGEMMVVISVGRVGAILKTRIPMQFSSSINASGLPIAAGKVCSSGEEHLTDAVRYGASNQVVFSDYGSDTESVVFLKRRANHCMANLSLEIASGKLHGFKQSLLDSRWQNK